jgi:hypothetical protein
LHLGRGILFLIRLLLVIQFSRPPEPDRQNLPTGLFLYTKKCVRE